MRPVAGQAGPSFGGLLRRLRDEAGLTQDELAEAAQVSQRAISDLERGINRTARKDTALLLAGALGLAGPARDLFVTVARGQAPATRAAGRRAGRGVRPLHRPPGRAGLAAAGGDRFSVPGAGRVRGTGCGVLFRPRNGHHPGAGPDGAASGRRGAAGGVRRFGRGQVVAAAGRSAPAHPGGRAGGPRRGQGPGRACCSPRRMPRWTSWRCGSALLAGVDAAAVRQGLGTSPEKFALTARQAALARPRGPAGDPEDPAAERDQPPQRRLLLVADQFEELFTQCADEAAAAGVHHRAARGRHHRARTRVRHRRRWWCWACAPISRPAAPATRS